jgi:hypothetical protein
MRAQFGGHAGQRVELRRILEHGEAAIAEPGRSHWIGPVQHQVRGNDVPVLLKRRNIAIAAEVFRCDAAQQRFGNGEVIGYAVGRTGLARDRM